MTTAKSTFTHTNGKEQKEMRTEQTGSSDFTNTQWSNWKGEGWSEEHRSNQTWFRTQEEADAERKEWEETMKQQGWK